MWFTWLAQKYSSGSMCTKSDLQWLWHQTAMYQHFVFLYLKCSLCKMIYKARAHWVQTSKAIGCCVWNTLHKFKRWCHIRSLWMHVQMWLGIIDYAIGIVPIAIVFWSAICAMNLYGLICRSRQLNHFLSIAFNSKTPTPLKWEVVSCYQLGPA